MRISYFIVAGFLLLFNNNLFAQSYMFRVKGTYNSYSMSDEKAIQQELLQNVTGSGTPAAITESFPAYYGFQLQALYLSENSEDKEYHFGFFFDLGSTGGRISYRDYSGGISVDQLITSYSFGPVGEVNFNLSNNYSLTLSLSIPFIAGAMEFKNESTISNTVVQRENVRFTSFNVSVQPGAAIYYNVAPFSFGIHLDYFINFPATYSYEQNKQVKLRNKSGDEVKTGFGGPRLAIGAGISF